MLSVSLSRESKRMATKENNVYDSEVTVKLWYISDLGTKLWDRINYFDYFLEPNLKSSGELRKKKREEGKISCLYE